MNTETKPRTRLAVQRERIAHVAEQAAKSFADHRATLLFDTGTGFRAWRCQRPNSWVYGFDLYAVPGRLMVFGDMGTLVLVRQEDMLAWARGSIHDVGYFAEKVPREIPVQEYDPEMVRGWVAEIDADVASGECEPDGKVAKAWSGGARDEVLRAINDGKAAVGEVVHASRILGGDVPDFENWEHGFLWRREAIKWFLAQGGA